MSTQSPTDVTPRSARRFTWWLLVVPFLASVLAVVAYSGRPVAPSTGGQLFFEDDFERNAVGADYRIAAADQGWKAGEWQIKDGRLLAEKIHNAALWLKRPLPSQVRIEFDVKAHSESGDLKCEAFGDGRTHQSGYIFIMGGWKNTVICIARLDEHGEDRKNDNRCPRQGNRRRCVEPEVDYHWAIERRDNTVKWYVDGRLQLTYPDAHPLQGRHFAFNNWEAKVSFDNLRIFDLGSGANSP